MRSLLSYIGLDTIDSENTVFRDSVISTEKTGSKIGLGPESLRNSGIRERFEQRLDASPVARMLQFLAPTYDLLVFLGFLFSSYILLVGLLELDFTLLAFSAFPLAFCVMHALVLNPLDRMALPVYPIVLANLCLLPVYVWDRSVERPLHVFRLDRWALPLLIAVCAILSIFHVAYLSLSQVLPSADEGHYMSGVYSVGEGIRSGTLAGAWSGYISALGFKAPLICLPAVGLSLIMGGYVFPSMFSLVLIFAATMAAAYSLFRNCLARTPAAAAAVFLGTMPLVTGLTHRFYVEGLLLLLVVIYLDVLIRFGFRGFGGSMLIGLIIGLGVLCKLTFLALSMLPLLYHCCPVKSRIESIGWGHRGIRFGSRMAGVPVKWAFFRIA